MRILVCSIHSVVFPLESHFLLSIELPKTRELYGPLIRLKRSKQSSFPFVASPQLSVLPKSVCFGADANPGNTASVVKNKQMIQLLTGETGETGLDLESRVHKKLHLAS